MWDIGEGGNIPNGREHDKDSLLEIPQTHHFHDFGSFGRVHDSLAVNAVVATALARDPLHLPTYVEVMAEVLPIESPAPKPRQAAEMPTQEVPASKRRRS